MAVIEQERCFASWLRRSEEVFRARFSLECDRITRSGSAANMTGCSELFTGKVIKNVTRNSKRVVCKRSSTFSEMRKVIKGLDVCLTFRQS